MKKLVSATTLLAVGAGLVLSGLPAGATHTDPQHRLSSTRPTGGGGQPTIRGAGIWQHIRNFRANPGSDLEFFRNHGQLFVASGTLGQADEEHVGQRIVRLERNGKLAIRWLADHGSANCPTANPGGTLGLQHDSQVTPKNDPKLLIDTTDASGRCHDPGGGGLELIYIEKLGKDPGFWKNRRKTREIHLTRHAGTSHTHTVDAMRPWIVYNSSSEFAGRNWIDVLDIRSCLQNGGRVRLLDLCRPEVSRIPFHPNWSRARDPETGRLKPGTESSCHDITSKGWKIYCGGLNASLVFDVRNLTRPNGAVRGPKLPCTLEDGTRTRAKVTDCSMNEAGAPAARGWRFLGSFNHPGRDCSPAPVTTCNSNLTVPADEGVAVSHEADPSHNGRHMFVTDERGGGVVPPGASCEPGVDNPYGNGGIHVFNINRPRDFRYARTPTGDKAVWISDAIVPAASFCTVHVIERIPGEQRLAVAYYSQGVKLVDYWIDDNGRWIFRETASLILPGATTWAFEDFRIRQNRNGTKTYWFVASDISRGIDIIKWRGRPNPVGSPPPPALAKAASSSATGENAALLLSALLLLPAAALGRRRRLRRAAGRS